MHKSKKKHISEDKFRYVDSCRHTLKKRSAVNTICDFNKDLFTDFYF